MLWILISFLALGCAVSSENTCRQSDSVDLLQARVSVHPPVVPALPKIPKGTQGVAIPYQIFVYWNGNAFPKLVNLCIDAIRRTNPGWKVKVLSHADLANLPEPEPAGFSNLGVQHQADWLRLVLLKRYGGVWLDASSVPLKPVTSWVDVNSNTVQGFETPWYEPDCRCQIIENWAIASPPGNALVEAWLREYERAIAMGFDNYQKELLSLGQAQGKHYKVLGDNLPYLTQHAAFMRVHAARQADPIILHSSGQGPLWFVAASNYSAPKAAELLTSMDKDHCAFVDVPFLKLPGRERSEVEQLLEASKYTGNSVLHSALGLPSSTAVKAKVSLSQSISAVQTFLINMGDGTQCMGTSLSSASALGMQTTELGNTGEDAAGAALRNNVSKAAVRFSNAMPGYTRHLLAHATAWKRVIDGNLEEALVFESGTSLSSSSQTELCSVLSRRPKGSLFQLATQPIAVSCCQSSQDGDCLGWKPGGEYGSQAYLLTRSAAVELYNRLETGKLMWPTAAPVSYALRTASHAYHLKMPVPQPKPSTPLCGKAIHAAGCGSAVHIAAPASDHALASTCAAQIGRHSDAVRKAGFPIPTNGLNTASVEGGSSFNEATYLGELVRKMPSNSTLCQTGFNYGTSAVGMLCAADPTVKLYSWDLGEHLYVKSADKLVQAKFQKRHFLTLGDSTVTLKEAIAEKGPLPSGTMCDFVFVDGGHSLEVAMADILNFKSLAKPGSMLVVDDCGEIGKPGADAAVSNAFMQAVADGHVVPDADTALRLHTDFHSHARSICVGHYS